MTFGSGTAEAGEGDPVLLCIATDAGVRVKNLGGTRVFLGGPDVTAGGYPLEPGETEVFYGSRKIQSPVVPAPPGDMYPDALYIVTAEGTGVAKVSWIGV